MLSGTLPRKSPQPAKAGQIYPYLKNTRVFRCPDDLTLPAPTAQIISYGYNEWLPASSDVKAMPGRVLTMTKTVLLFEVADSTAQVTLPEEGAAEGAQRFSASGYGDILACRPSGGQGECKYKTGWMGDVDPHHLGNPQFPDQGGRHTGGADYLLVDGHVKWLLPSKVLANNHPPVSDTEFDTYEAHFTNENYHRK